MIDRSILTNFFEKWLKSVDLISLILILFLMILGLLFVTTTSPNVAKLKSLNEFHFIKKHYFFTFLTLFFIIIFSFFSPKGLVNISYAGLTISIFLITTLLLISAKNNGSIRWLNVFGYSFQPSEFLKPFIIIICTLILIFIFIPIFILTCMFIFIFTLTFISSIGPLGFP